MYPLYKFNKHVKASFSQGQPPQNCLSFMHAVNFEYIFFTFYIYLPSNPDLVNVTSHRLSTCFHALLEIFNVTLSKVTMLCMMYAP